MERTLTSETAQQTEEVPKNKVQIGVLIPHRAALQSPKQGLFKES